MSETRHARETPDKQLRVLSNALDAEDDTALARAVRRGASPDARDVNGTPLLLQVDDPRKIRALIHAGATVDIRDRETGETPLIRAARLGHAPVVQALLAAGASVHARTVSGDTALSEARRGAHAEVIELLRRAGAPDREDAAGDGDIERR